MGLSKLMTTTITTIATVIRPPTKERERERERAKHGKEKRVRVKRETTNPIK